MSDVIPVHRVRLRLAELPREPPHLPVELVDLAIQLGQLPVGAVHVATELTVVERDPRTARCAADVTVQFEIADGFLDLPAA
ncbi:protein of unknown function [Candidatus Filomicrobium marinum]|uniref:Uncharacterized protein n=1 Tax=Candidatus Filomicrobium marinum TaxID=1608628 RepID=A0A0D6JGH7_9HYPH|nr:protein of unknown function [Candidatus Filomicrobium marinum]CPR19642.1 protein of unknown function [Candidatus Filomicrobium marinum]